MRIASSKGDVSLLHPLELASTCTTLRKGNVGVGGGFFFIRLNLLRRNDLVTHLPARFISEIL